ncbi:MAG: hypothetical protein AB1571_00970 [Nanoarchaeota archaeon]
MLRDKIKKGIYVGVISGLVLLVNNAKSEENPLTKYEECMAIAQKGYEECLSTSQYLFDQCLDGCKGANEIEACTDKCFDDKEYRDTTCKDDYDVDKVKCKGKSDLEEN